MYTQYVDIGSSYFESFTQLTIPIPKTFTQQPFYWRSLNVFLLFLMFNSDIWNDDVNLVDITLSRKGKRNSLISIS